MGQRVEPQRAQLDSASTSTVGRARNWRVIHACEYARDVLPVIEDQVSVGMRPYIVTPEGAGTADVYLAGKNQEQPRPLSLLRSWQDVRNWRKSLLDCAPETTADLVHAHCFAAGMAAVRSCNCVVYDLDACIEELAISLNQCEPGSWMGRSFRVAEQFILSRAAAVIVHSEGLKQAAVERGAAAESVFTIPEPVGVEEEASPFFENDFLARRFNLVPDSISFFVPQFTAEGTSEISNEAIQALEAFALAANELPEFNLLLEAPESARKSIQEHASRLGISRQIVFVDLLDVAATLRNAHVIVALNNLPEDPVAARKPNQVCLKSLSMGKTLLAADVPRNRAASPEGRGCLWFEKDNARDLGYRIAFLGRNRDFRTALGAAGRIYIFETRNSSTIGKQYDEAYRYANSRKKPGNPIPPMSRMETAENWG